MKKRIAGVLSKIENLIAIRSIRYGLVTLLPVLMLGSFALVLNSAPLDSYQAFIAEWNHGVLVKIFNGIYNVTFGMLSVYTAAVVGYRYGILYEKQDKQYAYATLLVSLACFFILSGVPECEFDVFGAKGMFTAILSACVSSCVFIWIMNRIHHKTLLIDGSDVRLGFSIQVILPAALTVILFVIVNRVVLSVFHVSSVYELLSMVFSSAFSHIGNATLRAVSFIEISSILWFFGMHGSNMLEGVVNDVLGQTAQVSAGLAGQGQEVTGILSKQFMDVFVLMGGCGATICLLGALLLFSRRSNAKHLAKISALPMLFNINEIMVFGLPIIYNVTFLIPFLCTPIVCFLTTYISMKLGLVPPVTQEVQWTTPILFNGYKATGSIAGSVMQLVNLCIGIAIYAPFVRRYDREKQIAYKEDYEKLVDKLKESELTRLPVSLSDISVPYGWMGKALVADLQHAMQVQELQLYYQPQFHAEGYCIGAEALLRWNHKTLGMIYPPLVFQLAEEAGFLETLEEWIVGKAISEIHALRQKYPDRALKISVNVTGLTIQSEVFEEFLKTLSGRYRLKEMGMCIEITEQAALQLNDELSRRLHRIREMGYILAVDDFSMGSTSIQYLTGNYFDLVKLDGSLVRGILDNSRCCEIISSIIQLSHTLELNVLAEYVSNAELQEKLLELGCFLYQGWYYSPAIPFEEFDHLLESTGDSLMEKKLREFT